MTMYQLQALIGCTLKYKALEIYIKSIDFENNIIYFSDEPRKIEFFLNSMFNRFKIYLTEEEDSLVNISYFLDYYNIT